MNKEYYKYLGVGAGAFLLYLGIKNYNANSKIRHGDNKR